jgi:hypothetical protein
MADCFGIALGWLLNWENSGKVRQMVKNLSK